MLSVDGGRAAPGLPPHRNRSPEDRPRPPPSADEIRRRSGRGSQRRDGFGRGRGRSAELPRPLRRGAADRGPGCRKMEEGRRGGARRLPGRPGRGNRARACRRRAGARTTRSQKLVARGGGEVLAYDVPKPKDPSVWVRSEFARLGAQATDDAARRLVEIAGDDIGLLEQEVEKLATWAGGEQIGPREVEELAVPAERRPPPGPLGRVGEPRRRPRSSPRARRSSRRASSRSSSPSGSRRRSGWSEPSRRSRTKAWAPGRSPGG